MKDAIFSGVGFLIGVLFCLLAVAALGESPAAFLRILYESSFHSAEDFSEFLFIAIPLCFTGLSVAMAYQAGLFNIGAEGQLIVGAIAAVAVGATVPVPYPFSIFLAVLASFSAGALWAFFPGYFRAYRGSHEVIHGIMMNFLAMAFTGFITLYILKDPGSPHPDTLPISFAYELESWNLGGVKIPRTALWLALSCLAFWVIFKRSVFGYVVKATGKSFLSAKNYGLPVQRTQLLAMMLAGGLAGLVGAHEILAVSHKFRIGFSPDYGYVGIAIAMLARGSVLGVIGAAALFTVLQRGALVLDIETEHITRDFGLVIQGLLILSTASGPALKRWWDAALLTKKGAPSA